MRIGLEIMLGLLTEEPKCGMENTSLRPLGPPETVAHTHFFRGKIKSMSQQPGAG
jgi:hypothetical protein